LLGSLVHVFSHGADLTDPAIFTWGLLVENKYNIARHTFLRYQNFLVSIDNKVTTLIVATFFCVFNDLLLTERRKMAKLTADHNRDLTYLDFVALEKRLFT
jgi:hypothetical protein